MNFSSGPSYFYAETTFSNHRGNFSGRKGLRIRTYVALVCTRIQHGRTSQSIEMLEYICEPERFMYVTCKKNRLRANNLENSVYSDIERIVLKYRHVRHNVFFKSPLN